MGIECHTWMPGFKISTWVWYFQLWQNTMCTMCAYLAYIVHIVILNNFTEKSKTKFMNH
jgi:hypothetical protein